LALVAGAFGAGADGLALIGRVEHPELGEISGIVKSTRGDFYWVHNDSGDSPRIFAIDAAATPLRPEYLGVPAEDWQGHAIDAASHFDWEDIALADGVLYSADVGNNGNARRDLGVYVVNEPDPQAIPRMRSLRHLPIRYPDQRQQPGDVWHFDCEAVFVADGKLYFITKHRLSRRIGAWEPGAKLYRLDSLAESPSNALILIDRNEQLTAATAAALSPDGATLAVLSYTAIWLFEKPETGDAWLSAPSRRLALHTDSARQVEAIAWLDGETLIVSNEQRDWFEVPLALFPQHGEKARDSRSAKTPSTE